MSHFRCHRSAPPRTWGTRALPSASREVVIIGAGLAGATLAYELLQGGLKPLILDKAVFPRIKVCAGGLTIKAIEFLPPDLGPVLEDEIRRVQLSFNLGAPSPKPRSNRCSTRWSGNGSTPS